VYTDDDELEVSIGDPMSVVVGVVLDEDSVPVGPEADVELDKGYGAEVLDCSGEPLVIAVPGGIDADEVSVTELLSEVLEATEEVSELDEVSAVEDDSTVDEIAVVEAVDDDSAVDEVSVVEADEEDSAAEVVSAVEDATEEDEPLTGEPLVVAVTDSEDEEEPLKDAVPDDVALFEVVLTGEELVPDEVELVPDEVDSVTSLVVDTSDEVELAPDEVGCATSLVDSTSDEVELMVTEAEDLVVGGSVPVGPADEVELEMGKGIDDSDEDDVVSDEPVLEEDVRD
jgi:hypothetical protein